MTLYVLRLSVRKIYFKINVSLLHSFVKNEKMLNNEEVTLSLREGDSSACIIVCLYKKSEEDVKKTRARFRTAHLS